MSAARSPVRFALIAAVFNAPIWARCFSMKSASFPCACLERVVVETTADVIGRRAFDEWVRERSRFYPGHWDVDARETARAARPTIITPYPAAPQASPLLSSPIHDMESVTNGVWRLLAVHAGHSHLAFAFQLELVHRWYRAQISLRYRATFPCSDRQLISDKSALERLIR